jgi:hypothetical protein
MNSLDRPAVFLSPAARVQGGECERRWLGRADALNSRSLKELLPILNRDGTRNGRPRCDALMW